MRRLLLALVTMTCVILPATAGAADLHATPSTFASNFASAQGGDTIFLAAGSYGSFNGGAKSSMVTIQPEPGAAVTMSGGNFSSSVRNITIKGITYTGPVEVDPGSTPLNLVFDGDTWGNVREGTHEGRLSIVGGGSNALRSNGVQVKNSTFGPGGCSDGIQDSSKGTEIGPNNEFKGIVQGSCSQHADAIQPYASNYVWIHDNFFHDNEQGIMSPDGVSTGYLIENNVIHTSTGYPCMHIGDSRNGTIRHNVCRNGSIRVYGGNQNVASQAMTVRDNVAGMDVSACTGCTVSNNLSPSQVTFTGGTGRLAYATASPKGTASDGTDIGLNGGSPPPPPPLVQCNDGVNNDAPEDLLVDFPADPGCTSATDTTELGNPPPPPIDHQPLAAFVYAPSAPAVGQTVSFDGRGSTCQDTPCTYVWADRPPNGEVWPVGPDGPESLFPFQQTGTKYVTLTVTDADGDTATIEHDVVVAAQPPPPPPPAGCNQACEDAYKAQINGLTVARDAETLRANQAEAARDAATAALEAFKTKVRDFLGSL